MPKSRQKTTSISTKQRQKLMIEALEDSLGFVRIAAKKAGIHHATHYEWIKKDEWYKNQIDNLELKKQSMRQEFIESKFYENINKGKEKSIIFALTTQCRELGYMERPDTAVQVNIQNNSITKAKKIWDELGDEFYIETTGEENNKTN